ncbi:MAG: glycosyltransferase family 4 protein [Acidobacteriia bacterium]|nr:glycosyltransferase family 4 protein [Terriglobia bacterium]
MVTTFYPPFHFGGDASYVRRLTHALARRGHTVTVIHDRDAYRMLASGPEPEPLDEPSGVAVHGLRSRIGPVSCFLTQQLGRPVIHGPRIAQILSQPFDVIHFHNISLVGGPGVLAYGQAIKLYTPHEHWLVCPSHTLWRHNRELCTGRQCLRCVLHYGRPPQLWRAGSLLTHSCGHVDAFLALSRSCADRHREFGFPFPMEVLPPFLTAESDTEPPLSAPARGRPYFLFAGRLEIIKGLQDVIPAFGAESPAELWIAGTGSFEPELRRLAKGKTSVRFLGHQSAGNLRALYRHALSVLMPSVCYEVFPMVVLEAFREATPIIARNLDPFPEIIQQSGGGLLFSTQDDLRQALHRMATDQHLRLQLSQAARAAFGSRWTEQVGMDQYFAVIERAHLKHSAQPA